MSEVTDLLVSIHDFHKRSGRKIARFFKKPLPEDQIQAICSRMDFPFPTDWYEMYRRFNGVDPGDALSLAAGTVFLDWDWAPLAHVELLYKASHSARAGNVAVHVPLGTSSARIPHPNIEVVSGCVRIVATLGGTYPRWVVFDSLTAMLRTIVTANERGLITYDARQATQYDQKAVARVVQEFNSSADFWDQYL